MAESQTAYARCINAEDNDCDCTFGKNFTGDDALVKARMYQNRHPCPNCDRGLAVSTGHLDMRSHDASADVVQPRVGSAD